MCSPHGGRYIRIATVSYTHLDVYKRQLQDGTLSATVSDSETTMVTTVEVNESDMDGRFAVTAKTLLDALKEIPEQPLKMCIRDRCRCPYPCQ